MQASELKHTHYIHICGQHQSFDACDLRNAAECLPRSPFFFFFFSSVAHKRTLFFMRKPTSWKHQAHCGPRRRQSVQEVTVGDQHTLSPGEEKRSEVFSD